jgi:hypothetical protein
LSVVACDGAVPIEKAAAAAIDTTSGNRFRCRIENPLLIEPNCSVFLSVFLECQRRHFRAASLADQIPFGDPAFRAPLRGVDLAGGTFVIDP